jgi:hypothetical protein
LHFQADSEAKNQKAGDRLIQATERWLAPVYEKLKAAAASPEVARGSINQEELDSQPFY